MDQKSDKVQPKIDDLYWFEFSKSFLDDAVARRERAAQALQQLVVWLWGIYTASAAVGFALSGKQLELWPTVVIALGSGLLILVYWGTVWVQIPDLAAFDPRSPTEIEEVFSKIVLSKSRRLTITLILSIVAAIIVSIGLIIAAVSKPSRTVVPNLQAVLSEDNGKSGVSVTAYVGKASIAELTIIPLIPTRAGESDAASERLVPTVEGLIQTYTNLNVNTDAVRVQLTWEDQSGLEIRLSKTIRRSSFGPA